MVCTVAVLHPSSHLRRAAQMGSSDVPGQESNSGFCRARTILLTVVLR